MCKNGEGNGDDNVATAIELICPQMQWKNWVGEWCKWLNELSVGCINQLGVYLKANKSTV